MATAVEVARDRLKAILNRSFGQPLGSQIDPGRPRGYYIDMRVKATAPEWPPPWLDHEGLVWVVVAQWGLGAFEHWANGAGEQWLAASRQAADYLIERQVQGGDMDGAWQHDHLYHTYNCDPPWASAMAQGQAASLLVRIGAETGDQRYAQAAARALRPFDRDSRERGVRTTLAGGPFFEEYPTSPPSYVLNGAVYALWGLYDVGVALDDAEARALFAQGLDVLADNIHRWDLGYWSRYDLYPHRRVNVASAAYHELHVNQLQAMQLISPRQALSDAAARFSAYAASRRDRRRALAEKAAFRLVVPR